MAPGGLYLAAVMARSMDLKEGDIVLDMGCGRGDSSIFLAKHYGVTVVCFDLWISSTFLSHKHTHAPKLVGDTPVEVLEAVVVEARVA